MAFSSGPEGLISAVLDAFEGSEANVHHWDTGYTGCPSIYLQHSSSTVLQDELQKIGLDASAQTGALYILAATWDVVTSRIGVSNFLCLTVQHTLCGPVNNWRLKVSSRAKTHMAAGGALNQQSIWLEVWNLC